MEARDLYPDLPARPPPRPGEALCEPPFLTTYEERARTFPAAAINSRLGQLGDRAGREIMPSCITMMRFCFRTLAAPLTRFTEAATDIRLERESRCALMKHLSFLKYSYVAYGKVSLPHPLPPLPPHDDKCIFPLRRF